VIIAIGNLILLVSLVGCLAVPLVSVITAETADVVGKIAALPSSVALGGASALDRLELGLAAVVVGCLLVLLPILDEFAALDLLAGVV
jgi:hypothetical protein